MLVDIRQWPTDIGARAFWEGIEVSDQCFAADDVEGWADIFVMDADGQLAIEGGELVSTRLHGRVEIDGYDGMMAARG